MLKRMQLNSVLAAGLLAVALPAASLADANQIKIGLITTLSGPQAVLGTEIRDGFQLAISEEGGSLGGAQIELIVGDDQTKPDVARQLADKMLERDKVAIVTGPVFSNVLLAIARPVLNSGTFLISPNAGPSELAGKQCNPNFYAASWQNDNTTEALGAYLSQLAIKRVYAIAPNYPAGKDKIAGFKRTFRSELVGEIYTQFGQLDYAAEIAQLRAAKPDAVFIFLPGAMGINFIKQFKQAGLDAELQLTAETSSLDETVLPAVADAAVGARTAMFWNHGIDNPQSRAFVASFEKVYRRTPSPYAAQAYDTARLISSALRATGGSAKDKDAFRAALKVARFDSVRGKFAFNTNNFPIQDWYSIEIVKDPQGSVVSKLGTKIFSDHKDAYASECAMK